jgi:hypothetical protein
VVDGLISRIDKIAYADEEKAKAHHKGTETILKSREVIARQNTEQSTARRLLVKMTFQVFCFCPPLWFISSTRNMQNFY